MDITVSLELAYIIFLPCLAALMGLGSLLSTRIPLKRSRLLFNGSVSLLAGVTAGLNKKTGITIIVLYFAFAVMRIYRP